MTSVGSLLGPESSADILPGNHVLWVIAMLLASPSERSSMGRRNGKRIRFGGDRVPDVLDQLEPLGNRELTDLVQKGSGHGEESSLGQGPRQAEARLVA